VRYDNAVPEPKRSVIVFKAETQEEAARAYHDIHDAMAVANFSDNKLAPRFSVVDLR
jgi:hypothetical protein